MKLFINVITVYKLFYKNDLQSTINLFCVLIMVGNKIFSRIKKFQGGGVEYFLCKYFNQSEIIVFLN